MCCICVISTEYTEWQRPLSGVHSIMMEKLAQLGKVGGCTPTPFQPIYNHVQSCSVHTPAESADTLNLFHLYPYVHCGHSCHLLLWDQLVFWPTRGVHWAPSKTWRQAAFFSCQKRWASAVLYASIFLYPELFVFVTSFLDNGTIASSSCHLCLDHDTWSLVTSDFSLLHMKGGHKIVTSASVACILKGGHHLVTCVCHISWIIVVYIQP